MNIIHLPIDIKSLYFNIKNDNQCGHTATVATPLKKTRNEEKLDDILKLSTNKMNVSAKPDLIDLLVKHSKSKVVIRDVFVFNKLSVNGKFIDSRYSFGCYIKEEIDELKVQFGRLKLHYPSKFVYDDLEVNINNKEIYKAISKSLNDYAFLIRGFDFDLDTGILNFDALIVGENQIPYSKVFVNEKGVGNKFNLIFNELADDYDNEIISLRKKFGDIVNPTNYLEFFKKMKDVAYDAISAMVGGNIEVISDKYPYSLFDFIYEEGNIRKYGILRVTSTKKKYFNISMAQLNFLRKNNEDVKIFLASEIFDELILSIFNVNDLENLEMNINSIKYWGD